MIYSISRRTAAPAAGAPFAQILPELTQRVGVRSITLVAASAVQGEIGIVRDATHGTNVAASTQRGQTWEPLGVTPFGGALVTAWTVAPTIAATPAYLARVELPATIGAGVTFNFDELDNGLVVPPPSDLSNPLTAGSLLIWNFGAGAGPALDVTVIFDSGSPG
jgi:hypothetical protein